jgi:hypothetical protein
MPASEADVAEKQAARQVSLPAREDLEAAVGRLID